MRPTLLASLFVSLSLGCSASAGNLFTGGPGGSGAMIAGGTGGAGAGGPSASASAGTGAGGGLGFDAGTSTGGSAGGTGCSAAAQLVYVFSLDNHIRSFDPPSKQFTEVAIPDCNTPMTPNSMAIDRNLVAWLNYFGSGSGGIFRFDLNKKSGCQQVVTLPAGFTQVGMGFSTDASLGTAETLYVDGIGGGGLAKVDMTTKQLVKIGGFANDPHVSGNSAELTGTGDAKLYGYFTTFPWVRVAQIDKTSGNIVMDHELTGVAPPSDWAFSFWGGDFYLYAAPGMNATGNSSVIHYNPTTQAVDATYVADVGFQIIGAGVSTCAPLKPPQ